MSRVSFGDAVAPIQDNQEPEQPKNASLKDKLRSVAKTNKPPRPSKETVDLAVRAGEAQGFVSREPAPDSREDTLSQERIRRRAHREEAGQITIKGPKRVMEAFRKYTDDEGLTSWQGLENLLKNSKRSTD